MGTVDPLGRHETASLGTAIDAYLATLAGLESAGTSRVYSGFLRQLAAEYGADTGVAMLQPEAVAAWFGSRWGQRSPSRWNVALDAVRSASRYWIDQGWLAEDPSRMLRRRRKAADRSRALSRADVERLLTREDSSIRERALWRLLYETAARSAEVLAWTSRTWTCRTGRRRSGARAARSTSSSGRRARSGSCRGC
jgi:site-specific recombinase XerD